jgi:hypothetical protein
MAFDEKQEMIIERHLERYGPSACPICEGTSWTKHPSIGAVCAQQMNGVNIFRSLQVIQLVCDECGYVVQYDAEKVGVAMEVELNAKR